MKKRPVHRIKEHGKRNHQEKTSTIEPRAANKMHFIFVPLSSRSALIGSMIS